MKSIIFIIIIFTNINIFAQTKTETYEYINQKLEIYANSSKLLKQSYLFQELKIDNTPYFNLIDVTTVGGVTAGLIYLVNPKDFTGIEFVEYTGALWLNIYFKSNKVITQNVDLETKIRSEGEPTSKLTFILEKEIPTNEKNRLKKALTHLLGTYNVNVKDLFD